MNLMQKEIIFNLIITLNVFQNYFQQNDMFQNFNYLNNNSFNLYCIRLDREF